MSESPTMPPILNKSMKFILSSPLHGIISKNLLLITFTGCKSGKTYTTPVSYSRQDGQIQIFSHADWWKNLRGGAPVTLRLQGRDVQGTADVVVDDKSEIAAALSAHLQKNPFDARFYDVSLDEEGKPISEDVERAVETVVMIRVGF